MGPKPLLKKTEARIRARWSAAGHKSAEELKPHYQIDVGLLLDEMDRLRYNVEHDT